MRYGAGPLGSATVYCPNPSELERFSEFLDRIAHDFVVVFPETARASDALASWDLLSVGPVHGATDLLAIAATVETPRYVHAPVQDTDLCALIATGGTRGEHLRSVLAVGCCRCWIRGRPICRRVFEIAPYHSRRIHFLEFSCQVSERI